MELRKSPTRRTVDLRSEAPRVRVAVGATLRSVAAERGAEMGRVGANFLGHFHRGPASVWRPTGLPGDP